MDLKDNSRAVRFGSLRHVAGRLFNKDMISRRLVFAAVGVGFITGVICSLFEIIPDWCNKIRCAYLLDMESDNKYLMYAAAFLVSAFLGGIAIYITKKFAPEAGGSGIPEIEGAMLDLRPVRWKRVLPVKFFGGILSLSSGMVLGREGPSIQIGGNLGAAISSFLHLNHEEMHMLLAAGAASGLASAFNAPLAGIIFVMEELRTQFRFSFASVQAVAVAVIVSTITRDCFSGTLPVFDLPNYAMPDLKDLGWFIVLGVVAGVLGVLFNRTVAFFQDFYQQIFKNSIWRMVFITSCVAGCFGVVSLVMPEVSGSGMKLISGWIITDESAVYLLMLALLRTLAVCLCFCSGIPGGIFAPSLSIGTLFGSALGIMLMKFGGVNIDPGIMAIVGMCTFFSATVRAPATGIILTCEMTNNFAFLLPMMISSSVAGFVAGFMRAALILYLFAK